QVGCPRASHLIELILPQRVGPMVERFTRTERRRRVVHQHGDATERPFAERNQILYLALVTHVGAEERGPSAASRNQPDGFLAAGFIDIRDEDGRAIPCEAGGDHATASGAARAGDDGDWRGAAAHCGLPNAECGFDCGLSRDAATRGGRANATMLLPDAAPFLPPPHTITTYWRPLRV